MEDLNAKVGQGKGAYCMRNPGMGTRNDRRTLNSTLSRK